MWILNLIFAIHIPGFTLFRFLSQMKILERCPNFVRINVFHSVVWRLQRGGAVLIRCAQLQVGLMCWRNASVETFFKEVMKCLKVSEDFWIETIADYRCTTLFNGAIQSYSWRGSGVFRILWWRGNNVYAVGEYSLCSKFFRTYPLLRSIRRLGWLTSLTQLLLDGYYRSIEGFQVLIEKEWLQFGHKFVDRCGFHKPSDQKERSPVFVQWLDCVHQLLFQYPRHFEFNDTFFDKISP